MGSHLILGSKKADRLPSIQFDSVFAANGALHHLAALPFSPSLVNGVFTPYLFSPLKEGNPYLGRKSLLEETLSKIQECPPHFAFIRPGATADKHQVACTARDFFPNSTKIVSLNRHILSWQILALTGVNVLPRLFNVSSGYASGLPLISQKSHKLSTGVLALALSLRQSAGKDTVFEVVGIGAEEGSYSYMPASVSFRKPHLEADIAFLKLVRDRHKLGKIRISDPELERVTEPTGIR